MAAKASTSSSGGSGDDTLTGGDGGDYLLGGGGDDTVHGGTGNDRILGGSGDDSIYGGEGNDIIIGDTGNDTIDAGAGDDFIIDSIGDDTLTGGTGADTFSFLSGHGSDTITDFDTSEDQIDLSQLTTGFTFLELQSKMSTVTDPDETTTVTGVQIDLSDFGGGTIILEGITSTSELTENMFCLPDCDSLLDDLLVENPVTGDDNINFIIGSEGDGTFTTLGGKDIVFSEEGDDLLVGGEGVDTLEGGAGDDWLGGGEGADTFVFNSGDGSDTITDFEDGTDTIDLSAISSITGFSDLTITQEGDDTKIDLGEDVGEVILQDFTATDLDATDFDFM